MSIIHWPGTYLAILALSLTGLGLLDWQQKLVLASNRRAAIKTWGVLMAFFMAWDIGGIVLNVFSTNQAFVTSVHIVSPNLPLEELMFLTLLIYFTLILSSLLEGRDK